MMHPSFFLRNHLSIAKGPLGSSSNTYIHQSSSVDSPITHHPLQVQILLLSSPVAFSTPHFFSCFPLFYQCHMVPVFLVFPSYYAFLAFFYFPLERFFYSFFSFLSSY
ncbi:hypothetical protein ABKN59_006950 [Abortiporus biennis]